jgi:hypothetical protein
MTALVRMRLAGFLSSGRVLAPLIAGLVVLGVIYGGGPALAGPAYGYSAVMLFPVLAWQAKLLLDTEPDGQRRLARLAVGARREAGAGALAAAVFGLGICAVAMLAPWPLHAIRGPVPGSVEPSMATGIGLGVLAHLLALPAGVALGALASRAVTRSVRNGIGVLVVGAVLVVVLGLSSSFAPWLVPPVMATARALAARTLPSAGTFWLLAGRAVLWCAVAFAGYGWLRRRRS